MTRPPPPACSPASCPAACFRCRRRLRPAAARTSVRDRARRENAPAPRADSCLRASGRSARSTLSGVIGTSSMRTPTASKTALATAGITGSSGPWPTSLAPNGQFGSGSSISITLDLGHVERGDALVLEQRRNLVHQRVGELRRQAAEHLLFHQRLAQAHVDAADRPGRARAPDSRRGRCRARSRSSARVIQPVCSSTSTSTTQAEKEYAGDGPTPAPLNLPGGLGGV